MKTGCDFRTGKQSSCPGPSLLKGAHKAKNQVFSFKMSTNCGYKHVMRAPNWIFAVEPHAGLVGTCIGICQENYQLFVNMNWKIFVALKKENK